MLSGIIFVNRKGSCWCDAPKEYGPHKTLYSPWKRWSEMGVFLRMMDGWAAEGADPNTIVINAAYLKGHWTASSLQEKGGLERLIGRIKGGMNTKLHAVTDIPALPRYSTIYPKQWLIGGRGCDADWFREAL